MARLRLMTWNVLFGCVATKLGAWPERGAFAREAILAAAPDVLALQEIDASQLAWVRTGLPGYAALVGEPSGVSSYPGKILVGGPALLLAAALLLAYGGPAPWPLWHELLVAACIVLGTLGPLAILALERYRGPFAPPGEYVPVLYRTDRLRVLAEGTHWISRTPDTPGTAYPLLFEPRLVRWVRFAFADAGPESRPFLVLAVHFGHVPWHYGRTARVALDALARHRASPAEPVFLLGDFNATPVTGVFRRLTRPLGPLTDARRAAPVQEGPPMTFQWNLSPGAPPLDLDHVLCDGPVRPLAARVLTPRPRGLTITDHDPVVVDFELEVGGAG